MPREAGVTSAHGCIADGHAAAVGGVDVGVESMPFCN